MSATLMTMSDKRWSIAGAKAGLSRLVQDASEAPQTIENRGRPVAVVLSPTAYERMAEDLRARERVRAFLALSAEIRAEGGVVLKIPRRDLRPSPLARRPR